MDCHTLSYSSQVYKWVAKVLILGGDGRDPVMDDHTLSHSTQVYKWVPKDLILGRGGRDSCYGLLSRPRKSKNIPSRLMLWRSAKWTTWLERRITSIPL